MFGELCLQSLYCTNDVFFNIYRGVDYALTINDVPGVAHRLPSLIKQV